LQQETEVTIVKDSGARSLTRTLAVISLLASAKAYPLGIGDIKLHSALNQNLSAEISLVLSPGENISDIKVKLASADKFDETGVPWSYFLSKIKFETVRSNNSVIIKLSSKEALKEPFLDFLLEVSWPKGSLYREFTVLVDPPAVYSQPTIPVSTPVESYEPEQDYSSYPPVVPKLQARKRKLNRAGEYGPTRKNDTLWVVAEQAGRGSNVSIEQMMLALYEENPQAFYKNNINALATGKTLKIPDRETVLKISRKQALAEFNRQTDVWKNRLVQTPAETVIVQDDSTNNQLTLTAPREAVIPGNVAITSNNEQHSDVENKEAQTPSPLNEKTVGTQGQATTSKAQESVAGITPAEEAIQSRVAALEKQLAVMQQLIALKDQQLSALQSQSQAKPVTPEQTARSEVKAIKPPAPAVHPTPPIQQPVAKPSVPAARKEPEISEPIDFYYLGVSIIGSGLLALLGWLWWRKRKIEMDAEGIFTSSEMLRMAKAREVFSGSRREDDNHLEIDAVSGDNLFLSDFTANDFDTFDMDQGEIDPVSEADVYLAYGRYQQAEELMRDAIKDQPERDEFKLKLLEIFYANENAPAFKAYATELAETGKRDNADFWAKVTEMGSDICSNSMLFSGGDYSIDLKKDTTFDSSTIAVHDEVESGKEMDVMDFDLASFDKLFDTTSDVKTSEIKTGLFDFDITSFEDEIIEKDKGEPNNASIDFVSTVSVSDTEIPDARPEGQEIPEAESKETFESFDFDFDFNADEEVKKLPEIHLDSLKDSSDSKHDIDFAPDTLADSLEDSKKPFNNSFDFDFDMSTSPSKEEAFSHESSFGMTSLADMDEMETKLDLAMAYIDMSDTHAAQDIAREVLEKGTAEQKMVAQSLLDNLQ
jgi:pilus assembly protein FimV